MQRFAHWTNLSETTFVPPPTSGRVHVAQDADGTVWVGGGTVSCVRGEVDL